MRTYNPEKRRERYLRQMQKQTPEQKLARRLYLTAWHHTLSTEDLIALWEEQAGRCKACGTPLDMETPRAFNVDHDVRCCGYGPSWRKRNGRKRVSCGRCVRGILCAPCNRAVGLMERYEDRVHAWMNYIRAAGRAS